MKERCPNTPNRQWSCEPERLRTQSPLGVQHWLAMRAPSGVTLEERSAMHTPWARYSLLEPTKSPMMASIPL